ncbi:MAG: transglycosylase domain-containing protein, partial [Solobacterium sp.]|nr:transglycosylase domain-containing protein [Solobacterium sp.]
MTETKEKKPASTRKRAKKNTADPAAVEEKPQKTAARKTVRKKTGTGTAEDKPKKTAAKTATRRKTSSGSSTGAEKKTVETAAKKPSARKKSTKEKTSDTAEKKPARKRTTSRKQPAKEPVQASFLSVEEIRLPFVPEGEREPVKETVPAASPAVVLPEIDASLPAEEVRLPIEYAAGFDIAPKLKPVPPPEPVPQPEPEPAPLPEKKKKKKKTGKHRGLKAVLAVFLLMFAIGGAAVGGYIMKNLEDVPELDLYQLRDYSMATQLYDINGNFVAEYQANENVDWAYIDEVPQHLKDAFISIEDKRFYKHHGLDLPRFLNAVWGQLTHTSSHGGSTITQQVIKNTYLTQEVTYKRKIQEIYLALKLERELDKDQILEVYMNTIFYGDSNYGIKVAAWDYFGKTLDELTLRECAILAGLAQSPNEYNPRLNMLKGDMGPTNYRANTVLYAMHENGVITDEEYEEALNDTLVVREATSKGELYQYPAYVEYAVEDVAKALLVKEGKELTDSAIAAKKALMRQAGYRITLGIDTNIQQILQDSVATFNGYPYARDGSMVEASAVVIDQHTGRVVAMVGSREVPTEPEVLNRATDSLQPVGSSMKPLAVYAPALEEGCYPGTTVMDIKEDIPGYGIDNDYPNGPVTGGAITMREALELSHNVAAARFMLEKVGVERSFEYLLQEGFDEAHLDHTPAGLALGAVSVTTLEMAGAYATLANGGIYIQPHAYVEVLDRNGNVLLSEDDVVTRRVFAETTAWLITDMMHTNMIGGLGVEANLRTMTCAGKTGTHEDKTITFGGYTPYYTSFLRISSDSYTS